MRRCVIILVLLLAVACAWGQGRRALLVGVSDYGNPKSDAGQWLNIHGAEDVKLLKPELERQGFVVTTLTEGKATKNGIVKGIEALIKSCDKGDIVYLHFSLHGQPVEDLNGDEADGWDEALVPVDAKMRYKKGEYEGDKHLIDDELEKLVNKLRTKVGQEGIVYLALDACHAGSSSRGEEYVRGTNEGFSKRGKSYEPNRSAEQNDYFKLETKKDMAPVVYMEACKSYQRNRETRDRESGQMYGSLSYHIVKVIKNQRIGTDIGWVTKVKKSMETDHYAKYQTMVIESSK